MKYNYSYFKNGLPEWKWKKEPLLGKIFYRRVSFFTAAFCANLGISANKVSYASTIVAIAGCMLFLINDYRAKIIGALLVNVWLIMDCTDGNLARCVKKQPFGGFADSMSSYVLVGLLGTCIGFSVYQTGGIIIGKNCPWTILIGAFASSSDTLMRLIYHKFKEVSSEMVEEGFITEKDEDKRTDNANVGMLQVRIEMEFGIGGIIPMLVLLGAIFNALDITLFYCFAYYFFSCIVMVAMYIRKAVGHTREWERQNNKKIE